MKPSGLVKYFHCYCALDCRKCPRQKASRTREKRHVAKNLNDPSESLDDAEGYTELVPET